jgi:hypothetical protein
LFGAQKVEVKAITSEDKIVQYTSDLDGARV